VFVSQKPILSENLKSLNTWPHFYVERKKKQIGLDVKIFRLDLGARYVHVDDDDDDDDGQSTEDNPKNATWNAA